MSEVQQYPKWLYHKTESAVIVQDEAAQKELGKGWEETPFNQAEPTVELELQHDFEVLAHEEEIHEDDKKKTKKGHK